MIEEKKSYHERVAEEVIKALQNGTAPWVKPWEPGQAPPQPVNAVTGKPYRGFNRTWLAMHQTSSADPRWCTYRQARELGGQVKAGSRGVTIQYLVTEESKLIKDDKGKPILDADGKKQFETILLKSPKVMHYTVFNGAQIDNLPQLPPREAKPAWERHDAAERLLNSSGAKIIHDQGNRAVYRPITDEIYLPQRSQFATPDKYYATALHEVGHWSGHESRLDRDINNPYGSQPYAREELRAELASYMMGADLDIGHDPGQHHTYIASWIEILKKDPREIIRAAQDAEKIRDYVMSLENVKQTPEYIVATDQFTILTTDRNFSDLKEAARFPSPAAALQEALAIKDQKKEFLEDSELFIHQVDPHDDVHEKPVLATGTLLVMRAMWQKNIGSELPDFLKHEKEKKVMNQPTEDLQASQSGEHNQLDQSENAPLLAQEKTWLNVPYKEKDGAKAAGAKWDKEEKRWFAPEGTDLSKLAGWIPSEKNTAQIETSPQTMNPYEEFGEKLRQAGLVIEGEPVMDGKIHRAPVVGGKPGAKDGAYCGHTDGIPNGWYKNHKSNEAGKWQATGHRLSPEAMSQLKEETENTMAARAEEKRLNQDKAMKRVYAIWKNAEPASPDHPYLKTKGLAELPTELRQDKQGNLLVPGYNLETGRLQTLQHISPAGDKWFEEGCPKVGAVALSQLETNHQEVVIIAEGYATGATLYAATGLPVAIAFDAGNLKEAASAIKKKLPNAAITICADNDHKRENNVGVEKAKEAAAAVGGKVVVPEFLPNEKAKGLSDFNDLHKSRGLKAVQEQVFGRVHSSEQQAGMER